MSLQGANEQLQQEVEALSAIYGESLTLLSPSESGQPRLRIALTSTPSDDVEGESSSLAQPSVAVELTLTFSDAYPDDVPYVHLRPMRGLTVNQAANVKLAIEREAVAQRGVQMVRDCSLCHARTVVTRVVACACVFEFAILTIINTKNTASWFRCLRLQRSSKISSTTQFRSTTHQCLLPSRTMRAHSSTQDSWGQRRRTIAR